MATNELIKSDELSVNDMVNNRSSPVNRLTASIYLLMCHISYYLIHYSSAFLMILFLLNISVSSLLLEVLAAASILAFIYNYQDSLLYYPNSPADSRLFVEIPSKFGLPYEDFFIETRDGVSLHAYLIKQPTPSNAFTFVFLHGNAGNIGHRLMNAQLLYQNCQVNIMLLEYRGFGRSKGSPSEEGLLLDAATAVDYVASRAELDSGKVVIFGRSLGGAVAIGTASLPAIESQVAGLIVENTFTSITDMAKALFKLPIFDYWPKILVKNKFVSLEKIARVQVPTLFISGLQDELVPPAMMRLLFERSRGALKRLFLCQNGTHNDSWRCPGYYEQITGFLAEIEAYRSGRDIQPSQVFTAPRSS